MTNFIIELAKSNPSERVAFFGCHFLEWWIYYFFDDFKYPLAPFHMQWIKTLTDTELNILIKGFRGSIKTSVVVAYITWCICYNKHKFIVWQSFGSDSSERMTKQVAMNLMRTNIESDYGVLFKTSGSREDMTKKSIGDFDTTNGVKVLATSLGEKLRGAISRNSRPDLLVLDDIDVSDSVRNSEIIDKNYEKITGETIGAMSKEKSRIIFLGNVINQDGVVPRFEREKSSDLNWKVFIQALYNPDGSVAWDFFTPDRIEKIRSNEGERAFSQNYLLVPVNVYEGGIIKEHELRYYEYISLEDFDKVYMHSDTTHTGKTTSDYFCTVVLGMSKKDKNYYVLDFTLEKVDVEIQARTCIALYQKYQTRVKKMTYDEKSNQGFGFWIKKLAREEYNISLPIEELKYPSDKVTHFDPHIPHFRSNRVIFPSKHKDIKIAVDQLLAFPTKGVHDDFVDGLSGVLDNIKNNNSDILYF